MKVLLLNGSPHEKGCTYTALTEIAKELAKENIDSEIMQVGSKPVKGCIACYACIKLNNGHCVFDDDLVNPVIDKIKEADAIVVGSPVYYAGISGQIKSLLDRVFFAGRDIFANKLAATVVSCRRGGASASFDQLNHYFMMKNMPVVSSQYWNQVHGGNAEDVVKDYEGMQTMRTLAKNMIWLLKCIEAGKQNGVKLPEYETVIQTNFIR